MTAQTNETPLAPGSRLAERWRTGLDRQGVTSVSVALILAAIVVGLAFLFNLRGWHEALGIPQGYGFRKLFIIALLAGLGAAFLARRASERIAGLVLLALAWVALLQPYHPFIVGYFEERVYSDRLLYASLAVAAGIGALVLRWPRAGFLLLVPALPLRLPVEVFGVTVHMMFLTYLLLWVTALGYIWRSRDERAGRDPLTLSVLAIAALASLSSFWAYDYREAILRTLYFYGSLPLAYLVVRLALRETGALKLALAAAVGSGIALSGLALYQFNTGYLFYNHPLQSAAFAVRNVQLAEGWTLWNARGLTEYRLDKAADEGMAGGRRIQTMRAVGAAHAEIFQYVPVRPGERYTLAASARDSGGLVEIYGLFYRDRSRPSVHDTRRSALKIEGSSPWRAGATQIVAPEDARYLQVSVKLFAGRSGAEAAVDDVRLNPAGSSGNLVRGGDFEKAKPQEKQPVRVNGVFYDPNIFGRYLMLVLLVVLAWTFFITGVLRRALLVSAAALVVSALLLTYSRSSLMGLVVGLAIILYYRRDLRATLGTVVGLLAVAVFFWSELIMRLPSALSAGEAGSDPSGGRVELAVAGLAMWKDSLVWGQGLGSFSSLYIKFASARAPTDLSESHNFFITTLGELGLLGALAVLLVLGIAVWVISHGFREGRGGRPHSRGLAAGLLASLVALVIHSSFQAYFFEDPFVWVVLGGAAAAYQAARPPPVAEV